MSNKKAVAYMRYSSNNQRETSIEHQRVAITNYCDANDIMLVGEYVDRAHTATNDKREAFQKLFSDIVNHPEWSMVIVYDFSRYARNHADATMYRRVLQDYNVKLISVTENFGESNEAFLLEGLTDLINEFYSRINSRVTHAGMTVKANKAGHCGGLPPLGYDVAPDGQLILNPKEAETVKRIFDMFELNYSYSRMAEILNREGRKNKHGKSFGKNSFNSLLQQEKYTGTYVWNKSRAKNSRHKRNSHAHKPVAEQTRIAGGCPQIISLEQFRRVQETLASRSFGRAASKNRYHYMLTGLKIIKCAECGAYMTGVSRSDRNGKYTTYSCPNHRNNGCPTKEIRTGYVDIMVAALLSRDVYHRKDLPEISDMIKQNTAEGKILKAQKRRIAKAIRNVTKYMETEESEILTQKLRSLEKEKQSIDRQIAKSQLETEGIHQNNKREVCKKFRSFLRKSEAPEVRAYLTHAVKEVLVSNEEVKITLNIA